MIIIFLILTLKFFASTLKKPKRSFAFPIRTYNKMEIDPMNSLVNVMSKLEKMRQMVVQLVVRSARLLGIIKFPAWCAKSMVVRN